MSGDRPAPKRPLSPAQLAILAAIEDGHDTVGALADATGCDRETVRRSALRLARRGLLTAWRDRSVYAAGPVAWRFELVLP